MRKSRLREIKFVLRSTEQVRAEPVFEPDLQCRARELPTEGHIGASLWWVKGNECISQALHLSKQNEATPSPQKNSEYLLSSYCVPCSDCALSYQTQQFCKLMIIIIRGNIYWFLNIYVILSWAYFDYHFIEEKTKARDWSSWLQITLWGVRVLWLPSVSCLQ